MTLKKLAQKLRKDQTDAERLLWRYLRNRQLNGYKFRRQYYIEKYIADFVCLEKNLIIELDGGQHQENINKDKIRTNYFNAKEFTVIRFWNNEILNNTNVVLEMINLNLINPHPNPLPSKGEGIEIN